MNITTSTALIELASSAYPKYLSDVRAANPLVSFSNQPTEELLASLGYSPVTRTVQPVAATNQVVEEGVPVETDGVWTQTWVARDMTADEIATALSAAQDTASAAVDAAREATFGDVGLSYTFPDGSVGHVQLRDTDRINLLALQSAATGLAAANSDTKLTFRSLENVNYELSAAECLAICTAATQFGQSLYQASWTLKQEIAAATQVPDVPAVPATLEGLIPTAS